MSLIYNGTNIPNTGIIRYNGTELSKVIYNGITVWEKIVYTRSEYTILQGRTQIDCTQGIVNFPTFGYNHTITGNTISINSPGQIVANTRCSVQFTARFMCENVDGQSVNCAIYLYKNNSVLYTLFGPADCGSYKDVLIGFSGHPYFGYTVTLEKGETLNYRVAVTKGNGSANARVNFYPKGQTPSIGLTQFIATPL